MVITVLFPSHYGSPLESYYPDIKSKVIGEYQSLRVSLIIETNWIITSSSINRNEEFSWLPLLLKDEEELLGHGMEVGNAPFSWISDRWAPATAWTTSRIVRKSKNCSHYSIGKFRIDANSILGLFKPQNLGFALQQQRKVVPRSCFLILVDVITLLWWNVKELFTKKLPLYFNKPGYEFIRFS